MNKKYNITILCGANPYQGPGIIALDLYRCLSSDGHAVEVISNQSFSSTTADIKSVEKSHGKLSKLFKRYNLRRFISKFRKKKQQLATKYVMLSVEGQNKSSYSEDILKSISRKPDFFIYMFSHGFLNPVDLEVIHRETRVPILFWLVDSEAMTGGCHFTWECNNYQTGCGSCPGLLSTNAYDQTFVNLKRKKEIFSKIDIVPVFATSRQKKMLLNSAVFGEKEKHQAYIIVDEDMYVKSKGDRKKFNLPKDKKLIFFASQNIDEERKGMRFLYKSLEILAGSLCEKEKENIALVIAGNVPEEVSVSLPFDHFLLGYMDHRNFSEVMSSVNMFLCPSVEDSGPMVINQSLMCGIPVVAFDMGVAPDLIVTGVTGYLAKLKDVNDFANGIRHLLNFSPDETQAISNNCRSVAVGNFSKNAVLQQFNTIFNSFPNHQ